MLPQKTKPARIIKNRDGSFDFHCKVCNTDTLCPHYNEKECEFIDLSSKPFNWMGALHWVGEMGMFGAIVILLGLASFFLYRAMFWMPADDYSTFVRDIHCEGASCNITFAYNVSSYWQAAGTGSDVPVVGGNDWIICLNGTEVVNGGDLRVGMLVGTAYLHFIEEINDGWVKTRGSNNLWNDPYRFANQSVSCVVAGVMR